MNPGSDDAQPARDPEHSPSEGWANLMPVVAKKPVWGRLEPSLLLDPIRYAPFAAAHHAAAHLWLRWNQGLPLMAAGLEVPPARLANSSQTDDQDREQANSRTPSSTHGRPPGHAHALAEATAVLAETLASDCVIATANGLVFGTAVEIDWTVVRERSTHCHASAILRGCVGGSGVSSLLREPTWVSDMGWRLLRGWSGIAALANALGRGRVLEADEVAHELGR